jgi:hypothetical protein
MSEMGSVAPIPPAPTGPQANDWPAWSAPAALLGAFVAAALAGLVIDIPALVLGVKITTSHTPAGIQLTDTITQDLVFVLTVIWFARRGGKTLRSWQLGLRPTPAYRAAWLATLTIIAFLIFTAIWAAALDLNTKEKLLEQLGTNKTSVLLALSMLLTTVIAPICEEILFRGYIFAALCKWRGWLPAAVITGVLFGGVHAGSAPIADLVPLAVLGFLLCALYRRTGSLYPCIAAHSLNNSLAFGGLEHWGWQIPVLMLASLVTIGLIWLFLRRLGVIAEAPEEITGAPLPYTVG